jgi:hypothetical protein
LRLLRRYSPSLEGRGVVLHATLFDLFMTPEENTAVERRTDGHVGIYLSRQDHDLILLTTHLVPEAARALIDTDRITTAAPESVPKLIVIDHVEM